MLMATVQGEIRHADPGIRGLLGVEPGDCLGRSLIDVIPEARLLWMLQEAQKLEGEQQTWEVALEKPRRRLTVAMSMAPSMGVEPLVSVLLALVREAENDVEANFHLRATIDAIMSGFAHEVRNPMAAILSITEAALYRLAEGEPSARMLGRIPGLVNRVDKLIKQSLRYSRPRPPQRAAERPGPMIDWATEMAQMTQSRVDFHLDLESSLAPVWVDAEQIEQVLVNLLCNAQDAARSRVTLAARRVRDARRRGGSALMIEVSDDGRGIAEEDRSRIFEPFFTTKAHGTGLGLAIARDLARLNGGDLELTSTSEEGTTFRLVLEEASATGDTTRAA
jgi:two-component system sensor histidine kinase PilS (NtrC family)